MAGEIAAKRHAEAVFEIASERNELEKWRSDLELMAAVLGSPELIPVLESPKIRYEHKVSAVTQNLTGISELAANLAKLLILKHRVRLISDIAAKYGGLMDRQRGVEHAEVITAVEMDTQLEHKIREQLARITGSEIELKPRIDPAIIGGFVARMGDKVLDGSVRNQLQNLKQQIVQTI